MIMWTGSATDNQTVEFWFCCCHQQTCSWALHWLSWTPGVLPVRQPHRHTVISLLMDNNPKKSTLKARVSRQNICRLFVEILDTFRLDFIFFDLWKLYFQKQLVSLCKLFTVKPTGASTESYQFHHTSSCHVGGAVCEQMSAKCNILRSYFCKGYLLYN